MYSYVVETARAANLDPALALAIADEESSFDPNAVSRKGAEGVMQLMPDMQHDLKVTDGFNPLQNVPAGIALLKAYLHRYNGDLGRVLTAYRSGPRNLRDHGSSEHDLNYIAAIKEKMQHYQLLLHQALISEGP